MSRGHGQLQRDLSGALESCDQPVDTFDLAAEVYRLEPNGDEETILSRKQPPRPGGALRADELGP